MFRRGTYHHPMPCRSILNFQLSSHNCFAMIAVNFPWDCGKETVYTEDGPKNRPDYLGSKN